MQQHSKICCAVGWLQAFHNRKAKFFSRSGKSQGICGWPGKFRKDLESQGIVREFEFENKLPRQDSKKLYIVFTGERMYFLMGCTFLLRQVTHVTLLYC